MRVQAGLQIGEIICSGGWRVDDLCVPVNSDEFICYTDTGTHSSTPPQLNIDAFTHL